MKSKDVLRVLRVTRPTLTKYVKDGVIRVTELPNGQYDYSEEDVYKFINKSADRITCVYASIWRTDNNKALSEQMDKLKDFCIARGYTIGAVYTDKNCDMNINSRQDLLRMIDSIQNGEVSRVVMQDKTRISPCEFELLQYIMKRYNCELVSLW